jgi:hypothetical protein
MTCGGEGCRGLSHEAGVPANAVRHPEVRALSCAPRRMGRRHLCRIHPSRLAEDGSHLRMTAENTRQYPRGAMRPSCEFIFRPKRAWGMPDAQCTRSPAGRKQATPVVTVATGLPETPSIPARNGFNSYFVLSPAIGLFCHRRLTDIAGPRPVGPTSPPKDLTPASRCQDHTTSLYASMPFVGSPVNGSQIFRQSALPSRGAQALPRPPHPAPRC